MAHEIFEKNPPRPDAGDVGVAIVGVHRRGAVLAARLKTAIEELTGSSVPLGSVDISFYRDDLGLMQRTASPAPVVHSTQLDFPLDGRTVVIVDDVLFTGRTVRAAIEVLFDYGRPGRVQLAVLVDRGHRELPIRPDYVGKNLPTARGERVNVLVQEIDGRDEVTVTEQAPGGGR